MSIDTDSSHMNKGRGEHAKAALMPTITSKNIQCKGKMILKIQKQKKKKTNSFGA